MDSYVDIGSCVTSNSALATLFNCNYVEIRISSISMIF